MWPCIVSAYSFLPKTLEGYHRGMLSFDPANNFQEDAVQENIRFIQNNQFPRGQTMSVVLSRSGIMTKPRLAVEANAMLSWSDNVDVVIIEPYDCYNQPITYQMMYAAVRTETSQYLRHLHKTTPGLTIRYWQRRLYNMRERNVSPANPILIFMMARAIKTITHDDVYDWVEIFSSSPLIEPSTRFSDPRILEEQDYYSSSSSSVSDTTSFIDRSATQV